MASIQSSAQINQADMNKGLTSKAVIFARSYKDSVILRWGVNKAAVWQTANQNGYQIYRAELSNTLLSKDKFSTLNFQPIKGSPFKPWTKSKIDNYLEKNKNLEGKDEYEMPDLVSEMLYADNDGKDAEGLFDNGFESFKGSKSNKDLPFGFSMLAAERSAVAALAMGVRTTDKNVILGKTYVYKIVVNNKGSNYNIEDGFIKVKVKPYSKNTYKAKVIGIGQEQKVIVNWEDIDACGSYNILWSNKKKGTYIKLNKAPIVNSKGKNYNGVRTGAYMHDSLVNYQKYYYQIWGQTAFADQVLLGKCIGVPVDLTPPYKPYLTQPKHVKPDEVRIKWEMNGPEDKDLKGFRIGVSKYNKGPFKDVAKGFISKKKREFIHRGFNKEGSNYYIVEAYDTAGNKSMSRVAYVTLIDSTPPAQPVYIKAIIDTSGKVKLTLKPNTEKDLMGYRILKSNSLKHEFSVIYETFGYDNDSTAKSVTIFDTLALNTLTKNAYYRATALDYHFNESKVSEAIKVTKPDTIRPVSPLIENHLSTEKAIKLNIIPSSSKDVFEMKLYRNINGKQFILYKSIDKDDQSFIDKDVKAGNKYGYMLEAVDEDGNKSKSKFAFYASPIPNFTLPEVQFILTKERDAKAVTIQWEYNEKVKGNYHFIVFKQGSDGQWKVLTSIKSGEKYTYIDKKIKAEDKQILYKIKVMSSLGKESILNEPQPIKVN